MKADLFRWFLFPVKKAPTPLPCGRMSCLSVEARFLKKKLTACISDSDPSSAGSVSQLQRYFQKCSRRSRWKRELNVLPRIFSLKRKRERKRFRRSRQGIDDPHPPCPGFIIFCRKFHSMIRADTMNGIQSGKDQNTVAQRSAFFSRVQLLFRKNNFRSPDRRRRGPIAPGVEECVRT